MKKKSNLCKSLNIKDKHSQCDNKLENVTLPISLLG